MISLRILFKGLVGIALNVLPCIESMQLMYGIFV